MVDEVELSVIKVSPLRIINAFCVYQSRCSSLICFVGTAGFTIITITLLEHHYNIHNSVRSRALDEKDPNIFGLPTCPTPLHVPFEE